MIKKIKNNIMAALLLFAVATPFALPTLAGGIVSASITDELCTSSQAASGEKGGSCKTGNLENSKDDLRNLASDVVDVFSVIIGAIAVIMLLYGGFRYITSGGDSGRVGNAKNTLLYAVIGLIIVALAQIIVNVVLGAAASAGDGLDA